MPAVQLKQLREQITRLAWHFTVPAGFQKELHELMEIYADRTYRPGQAVQSRPLIPSYHISPLVMRQLEQEMGRLCLEHPIAALSLVDLLWQDEYLEPRILAAALLGQVPLTAPEQVLDRLQRWSGTSLDIALLDALLDDGAARLRKEQPERWLVVIENWLASSSPEVQALGLKALLPVIAQRQFENLPRIYRLISPLMQNPMNIIQGDIQRVIEALARRSPAETAYFLRQMLSLSSSVTTGRIVRRCLPFLSEEMQVGLRKALSTRAANAKN